MEEIELKKYNRYLRNYKGFLILPIAIPKCSACTSFWPKTIEEVLPTVSDSAMPPWPDEWDYIDYIYGHTAFSVVCETILSFVLG